MEYSIWVKFQAHEWHWDTRCWSEYVIIHMNKMKYDIYIYIYIFMSFSDAFIMRAYKCILEKYLFITI